MEKEPISSAEADGDALAGQVGTVVRELVKAAGIRAGQVIVFGVSTSEVLGQRIGTSGTEDVAAALYRGIEQVRRETGFAPAFQCCEHLNRALVVERETAERYGWEEVSVVPVPKAGGSMAAYAYKQFRRPCVVEEILAHAGVDIGDTLIGMHLRRVAVPVRPSLKEIGNAHVTMAFSRPKLIGGARAVYAHPQPNLASGCDQG
jgi:uncharacterized protein (TIGR01440 family)